MNWIRFGSLLIALSLHGGVFYLIGASPFSDNVSLDEGAGADTLTIVATVALEGRDLFTQAAQEASVDATAAQARVKDPSKKEQQKEEIKPEQELEQALEQEKPKEFRESQKKRPSKKSASRRPAP